MEAQTTVSARPDVEPWADPAHAAGFWRPGTPRNLILPFRKAGIEQFRPGGRTKERGATHVYRSWDHRGHRGHRTYHPDAAEALTQRSASISLGSVNWPVRRHAGRPDLRGHGAHVL